MKIGEYNLIKKLGSHLPGEIESRTYSIGDKSAPAEAYTADKVELSSRVIEFNRIKGNIKEIPDVREEKIRGMSDIVRSGKYEVQSGLIASRLLREHVMDAMILGIYIEREI